VIPYAAESKSFNVVNVSSAMSPMYLDRFDTQHFTLEDAIPLPTTGTGPARGTRWAQDGLALLLNPPSYSSNLSPQIFLVRGPFVLPAEAASNPAPSLTSTDHGTISAGSGNVIVKVTGSGFLPGATVSWNASPRTTTYVDNSHVTVAIPATDVQAAGSSTLSAANPGSSSSNSITISVQ
jgi:hypothetical protein